MNSLNEAIAILKGKRIYIDVWATWCGPCKEDFENKSELNKLLATNNIETLYISIDKDDKEQLWKDMIKFYELEGCHIRSNLELSSDLRQIFGDNGGLAIPWYLLVNEDGELINDRASGTAQLARLEDEINKF